MCSFLWVEDDWDRRYQKWGNNKARTYITALSHITEVNEHCKIVIYILENARNNVQLTLFFERMSILSSGQIFMCVYGHATT